MFLSIQWPAVLQNTLQCPVLKLKDVISNQRDVSIKNVRHAKRILLKHLQSHFIFSNFCNSFKICNFSNQNKSVINNFVLHMILTTAPKRQQQFHSGYLPQRMHCDVLNRAFEFKFTICIKKKKKPHLLHMCSSVT